MTAPLVLIVSSDDELAALYTRTLRAPSVRARYVRTAVAFIRSMRPAVVVVTPDVSPADVAELTSETAENRAVVVIARTGDAEQEIASAVQRAIEQHVSSTW